jgi:hypothetical protein
MQVWKAKLCHRRLIKRFGLLVQALLLLPLCMCRGRMAFCGKNSELTLPLIAVNSKTVPSARYSWPPVRDARIPGAIVSETLLAIPFASLRRTRPRKLFLASGSPGATNFCRFALQQRILIKNKSLFDKATCSTPGTIVGELDFDSGYPDCRGSGSTLPFWSRLSAGDSGSLPLALT